MKETLRDILKAAKKYILAALLFIIIVVCLAFVFGKKKFDLAVYMLDIITIDKSEIKPIIPILKDGVLLNYPTYGTNYATLKIESINLELPVYYGANYTVLKKGIAHDEKSFFPGEGGSIILAGHNFSTFLADLPNVQNGNIIELETLYGTFKYSVYDSKIIHEDDSDSVPIYDDKEVLMIYTCWPINNIGHASKRLVVYANLINE